MSLVTINWNPPREQLRSFGLISLAAFGLIGVVIYLRHKLLFAMSPDTAQTAAYVLWALAAACGILSQAAPGLLRPLYVALMTVSLPIGFVISHAVVAVLYYGVITPIGLVFRLIGRDPLHRRFDPQATTYWVPRGPPAPPARYYRQF